MSKLFSFFVLLSFIFLIPVCKSNQSSSPPPPPATAQTITIQASSEMLHIGTSETFTATAQMSDGTTKAVTGGTWSGDNRNVATIEPSGLVTIVGSGKVNIFVDYQGARGTIRIRGLPNYQGTWSGSYYIKSCSHSGDFGSIKFCTSFPVNKVFPTDLILTQDEDRIDGRFYLGTLGGETSGPIQMNGELSLSGDIREGGFTIDVSWDLQSKNPGRITGYLYQTWRASGFSGDGRLRCTIRDLNRTSEMMMPPTRGGVRLINPTIEDLILSMMAER